MPNSILKNTTTANKSSSSSLIILNDLSDLNESGKQQLTQQLNRSSRLVAWHLFYSAMRLACSAFAKQGYDYLWYSFQRGQWLQFSSVLFGAILCFWFFIWK